MPKQKGIIFSFWIRGFVFAARYPGRVGEDPQFPGQGTLKLLYRIRIRPSVLFFLLKYSTLEIPRFWCFSLSRIPLFEVRKIF